MVIGFNVKRLLLAFLYGCLVNFMYQHMKRIVHNNQYENLETNRCPTCQKRVCPPCPLTEITLKKPDDIVLPYKPKGMYEISRWWLFDEFHVYDIINEEPKVDLKGFWKEEIKAAVTMGISYVNKNQAQNWDLVRLHSGLMRTDGGRGTDFLLDLVLKSATANTTDIIQLFRVHLVHPFRPVQNVKLQSVTAHWSKITIVIPISKVR